MNVGFYNIPALTPPRGFCAALTWSRGAPRHQCPPPAPPWAHWGWRTVSGDPLLSPQRGPRADREARACVAPAPSGSAPTAGGSELWRRVSPQSGEGPSKVTWTPYPGHGPKEKATGAPRLSRKCRPWANARRSWTSCSRRDQEGIAPAEGQGCGGREGCGVPGATSSLRNGPATRASCPRPGLSSGHPDTLHVTGSSARRLEVAMRGGRCSPGPPRVQGDVRLGQPVAARVWGSACLHRDRRWTRVPRPGQRGPGGLHGQ